MKPKVRKKTFADYAGEFTNKPFAIGGYGQDGVGGYDCIGLVYAFVSGAGKSIPDSFSGYTLDNYYKTFEQNKAGAEANIIGYFNSFADQISVNEKIAGDIVMCQIQGNAYPAIYAGNGNVLATFADCGTRVIACGGMNKVIKAWRTK